MSRFIAGIVVTTLILAILCVDGMTSADELKSPLQPREVIHMTYLPVPRDMPAAAAHHASVPAVQDAEQVVARDDSDAGLSGEGRR